VQHSTLPLQNPHQATSIVITLQVRTVQDKPSATCEGLTWSVAAGSGRPAAEQLAMVLITQGLRRLDAGDRLKKLRCVSHAHPDSRERWPDRSQLRAVRLLPY
jgi:hypothetical protein